MACLKDNQAIGIIWAPSHIVFVTFVLASDTYFYYVDPYNVEFATYEM